MEAERTASQDEHEQHQRRHAHYPGLLARGRPPRQGTSRLRRSAGRSTSTQLSQAMKQVGTSVSTSHTRRYRQPGGVADAEGRAPAGQLAITARCQR